MKLITTLHRGDAYIVTDKPLDLHPGAIVMVGEELIRANHRHLDVSGVHHVSRNWDQYLEKPVSHMTGTEVFQTAGPLGIPMVCVEWGYAPHP